MTQKIRKLWTSVFNKENTLEKLNSKAKITKQELSLRNIIFLTSNNLDEPYHVFYLDNLPGIVGTFNSF